MELLAAMSDARSRELRDATHISGSDSRHDSFCESNSANGILPRSAARLSERHQMGGVNETRAYLQWFSFSHGAPKNRGSD